MDDLEKLQHRVDLILPKLQSLKTANNHRRDNYIYIIKYSMIELNKGRQPLVWVCGTDNIKITTDIEGLNKYINKAERFLATHIKSNQ